MARHKEAEEDRHRKEIQEHAAKVVARRRQHALVPPIDSTSTPNPDPDPDSLSDEDVSMADVNNDIGALDFPSDMEDIGEMEIRGPSGIGDSLATSSSDELSDLPITQVTENETDSESDDDDEDEVIPSTYPPSIQVPATVSTSTAPTSTRSSTRSRRHTRKFESQHARDITTMEAKEERRKQREAKANRTGTGRAKAAEALAQTSQLLDGVELPFRSSQ